MIYLNKTAQQLIINMLQHENGHDNGFDPTRYPSSRDYTNTATLSRTPEIRYGAFLGYYAVEIDKTLRSLDLTAFSQAVDTIFATAGKRQIFIAGNGGSATIAEHLAHNLNWDASGNIPKERKLSARPLNSEMAEITARGNDRHYAYAFATQLDNYAQADDVFVAISASGNSDNIVKSLIKAKSLGVKTIFIGKPESKAGNLSDLTIGINSDDQQIIEDTSHMLIHMIIRALSVKLQGLDEESLMQDVAHLRSKTNGVEALADELGLPIEQEMLQRKNFERAVVKTADMKIEEAAAQVFPDQNLTISPFATDYTSFIRLVNTDTEKYVAKFSFGSTKPRLIHERAAIGMEEIARLALLKNRAVTDEFRRSEYLKSVFPELIPNPHSATDAVAFYQFIEGNNLEGILVQKHAAPMIRIGRLLRRWHDFFQTTEPPSGVQIYCNGQLDRTRGFQNKYATPDGIKKAFQPLFSNGYIPYSSEDITLGKIFETVTRLSNSPSLKYPRDTWGHGDFKPENILISSDGRNIYFVDNDFHKKAGIVDVGKMISRTMALCLDQSVDPDVTTQAATLFLEGYSLPGLLPDGFIDILAIDTMTILSGYSPVNRDALDEAPFLTRAFLSNPRMVIDYIHNLTTGKFTDIESLGSYFRRLHY